MNGCMFKNIRIKLAKYLTIFLSLLLITSKVAQSAEMPNHHFVQNIVMQNKVMKNIKSIKKNKR